MTMQPDSVGIQSNKGYTLFDVWEKKTYPRATASEVKFDIPAHGVVVLKMEGVMYPFNIFQYK